MGAPLLYVNVPMVSLGICWNCGIPMAAPQNFVRACREDDNKAFYCVNGHRGVFKKTETKRLQEELEATERRLEWANRGRDKAQRQAAAFKGKVTEIKNRVRNGVCPFCKRSFENLRRHMETKHPDCEHDDA